jgi:hypothetical protein
VVYVADQETKDVYDLYSVPIAGGPAVKLTGARPAGSYSYLNFLIDPASDWVLYGTPQETANMMELYRVPIGGGPACKVNDALQALGQVGGALISPDGTQVIYAADQETDGMLELYVTVLEYRGYLPLVLR